MMVPLSVLFVKAHFDLSEACGNRVSVDQLTLNV